MSSTVVLATGGYDQTIRIWDPKAGTALRTIKVQDSQVNALAVSPDKRYVVAALNPCVKIFDITSRGDQPIASLEGHLGNVTSVGFDTDARWIFTSGEDGTVRVFDPRAGTNACQRVFEPPPSNNTSSSSMTSPSNVPGSLNNTGATTTTTTGGPNPTTTNPSTTTGNITTTAAGGGGGGAGGGGGLFGLGRQQNQPANTSSWTEQRRNSVNSVVLHPNQGELICGDQGGRVRIYDVGGASKEPMLVLSPEPDVSVRSLCISNDGNRVMMATDTGFLYQFHTSTPDTLFKNQFVFDKPIHAHEAYILKVQMSPDMKYIATASADHQCKIWRTADMKCLKVLTKHQRWVWDVAFSADSGYLVTGSSDHSARLWDLSTGELVRNFVASKAIVAVALNDSGGVGSS